MDFPSSGTLVKFSELFIINLGKTLWPSPHPTLWFRYFSPSSSGEQERALTDGEGWLAPGIMSNPFLDLIATRPERGLSAMNRWWNANDGWAWKYLVWAHILVYILPRIFTKLNISNRLSCFRLFLHWFLLFSVSNSHTIFLCLPSWICSHHIEKRKCNTATCVTQRLADFLVRSSNTIGTVYAPTNVGSAAYGKRELMQPPIYLPL